MFFKAFLFCFEGLLFNIQHLFMCEKIMVSSAPRESIREFFDKGFEVEWQIVHVKVIFDFLVFSAVPLQVRYFFNQIISKGISG